MADCSAAGTALDRVAQSNDAASTAALRAAKSIGSFFDGVHQLPHHEAAGLQQLPAAPPHSIQATHFNVVPRTGSDPGAAAALVSRQHDDIRHRRQLDDAWRSGSTAAVPRVAHLHRGPMTTMHHPPHPMQAHHQMQMQMQFHQMQMQHQMQLHQAQMQTALQNPPTLEEETVINTEEAAADANQSSESASKLDGAWEESSSRVQRRLTQPERRYAVLDREEEEESYAWHDGLEEDAKAFLERHEQGGGHEGMVEPATIEELAEAWASAQDEVDLDESFYNDTVTIPYDFQSESSTTILPPDTDLDPMKEGMLYFQNGEILKAVVSFESELRSHPDNADAWRMLGKCHAENDEDRKAIACFERAVERDPYSLESLLALGVSYVNELDNARALRCLKAWVENNPSYAGMEIRDDGYGDGTVMNQVENLMLQALEWNPNDADVREALGVCYNVSRDYDAAVESLRNAISIRSDDYQLWNKLGATLANSNRSNEALPAYHEALRLKPKYARAWLNMAISHSNLRDYDEAARCYLQTLSLNPGAIHCWNYLRIALTCRERWDLLPLVSAQDLKAFRDHFDFIEY